MTLAAEALERLTQPLDPARVHKREGGGGRQLSYLEAHDVIRAANDIFGIGGWSYQTRELVCLGEEVAQGRDNKQGFRVAYRAVVEVKVGDSCFADTGYGDAVEYTGSKLTPHELAAKEAVSDAVKRCLKNYGDQFGLCLYDKDAPEHRGASGRQAAAPPPSRQPAPATPVQQSSPDAVVPDGHMLAGDVACPVGKNKGVQVRALSRNQLRWYAEEFNSEYADGIAFKAAVVAFLADPDATVPIDGDQIPF